MPPGCRAAASGGVGVGAGVATAGGVVATPGAGALGATAALGGAVGEIVGLGGRGATLWPGAADAGGAPGAAGLSSLATVTLRSEDFGGLLATALLQAAIESIRATCANAVSFRITGEQVTAIVVAIPGAVLVEDGAPRVAERQVVQ